MTTHTTKENVEVIFSEMKHRYNRNKNPSYKERIEVLKKMKSSLIENENLIYEALRKDYGYRSEFDTLMADILPSVNLINYTLKKLKKWMNPSKRHSGLLLSPSKVHVHYQPLGVVGVITPWNFPFFLALGPAIQAISAGNRVMIKMSEFTPNTNKAIIEVVKPISEHIQIIEGEADIGKAFSKIPFDHIIFTGSSVVGKSVAKAAANNLTPVTLELGGKSPTIIDKTVNMNIAVDAIILGKSLNSGQICVSPDYVFVEESRKEEFIETFLNRYSDYHFKSSNDNAQTHIISEKQYERLLDMLKDAKEKGAEVYPTKEIEKDAGRRFYPHLLTNVNEKMEVLNQEIFGSLLPIMTYKDIEEVISYINEKPRPLALYIMSKEKALIDNVINNTHSGGVAINDTIMHVAADDAPFGGVGNSGIGHYHGYEGFLTFSKAKTVLHSNDWFAKNNFILKNRDFVFKVIRKHLLK